MTGKTGTELLVAASRLLTAHDVPDGGRDARRLLAHVLNIPPGRLTLFLQDVVNAERSQTFDALIRRRCQRVPVSHLTGRRLFYGREFAVTSDVLDPRPETETLIETALSEPFHKVLDLGTGSGCILLTLLSERPEARGTGVDLSPAAIKVAEGNRKTCRLIDRANLRTGSWFEPLVGSGHKFDLIVSNPPYIAVAEMPGLEPEVRFYEPRLALTDEADGLTAYRAICDKVGTFLAPGGRLIVETGLDQGPAVRELMQNAGLVHVVVVPDLDQRDRVVVGRAAG